MEKGTGVTRNIIVAGSPTSAPYASESTGEAPTPSRLSFRGQSSGSNPRAKLTERNLRQPNRQAFPSLCAKGQGDTFRPENADS